MRRLIPGIKKKKNQRRNFQLFNPTNWGKVVPVLLGIIKCRLGCAEFSRFGTNAQKKNTADQGSQFFHLEKNF